MSSNKQNPKAAAPAPLAYDNAQFLNSADGRSIRILAEYQEPLARLRRQGIRDTVVFFGSARILSMDAAQKGLKLAPSPGSANSAKSTSEGGDGALTQQHADAAVRMACYYEDARRLAFLLTEWAKPLGGRRQRFVVTSGGGPGIMEAANRGAAEAGGKTIGFNITLPFEQFANAYITPGLNFQFHYFFMRKFWFAYLAKALIVFPGGFGTLDEMFECITLAQTHKLAKPLVILVYGSDYWKGLINFDQLIADGVISPDDMKLFQFVDTPEAAFEILRSELTKRFLDHAEKDEQSGEVSRQVPAAAGLENPELYLTRDIYD